MCKLIPLPHFLIFNVLLLVFPFQTEKRKPQPRGLDPAGFYRSNRSMYSDIFSLMSETMKSTISLGDEAMPITS